MAPKSIRVSILFYKCAKLDQDTDPISKGAKIDQGMNPSSKGAKKIVVVTRIKKARWGGASGNP